MRTIGANAAIGPIWSSALLLAATLVLWTTAALANANLKECIAADQNFDFQKVLTECAVAAQDTNLTAEQSIETYRLLGTAHMALGDQENASVWFTRLLVLNSDYIFPEDASPVYINAFMKAKTVFAEKGVIQVTHSPAVLENQTWPAKGTLLVRYTITDQLGQVQNVIVNVQAVSGDQVIRQTEIPLMRSATGQPGEAVFEGDLTDPAVTIEGPRPPEYTVRYEPRLQSLTGTILEPSPKAEIVSLSVVNSGSESDEGGGGLLWAGVGAGVVAAAGAAVLAGAGASVGLYCYIAGTCVDSSPPQAPRSEVQVTVGAVPHGY